MYCSKCGAKLGENSVYCASCGSKAETAGGGENWQQKAEGYARAGADALGTIMDTPDETGAFYTDDIERSKGMAILSYFGFLVFIPLFAAKDSPYARYHANQGLCLFLAELAWTVITRIVVGILGVISWHLGNLVGGLMGLMGILFFVMSIIGIINAVKGRARELPIIGGFRLIK